MGRCIFPLSSESESLSPRPESRLGFGRTSWKPFKFYPPHSTSSAVCTWVAELKALSHHLSKEHTRASLQRGGCNLKGSHRSESVLESRDWPWTAHCRANLAKKTVKAGFWPWLEHLFKQKSLENSLRCTALTRQRIRRGRCTSCIFSRRNLARGSEPGGRFNLRMLKYTR